MATSSQAASDSDKPSSSLPLLDHPDESRSRWDQTAKMLSATLSGVEKADEGRGDAVKVKESEAVAEEIKEEEGQVVLDEVMRIKATLIIPNQREDVLFDSLSILQQTKITVDVLQTTMIGKAVNALRKHMSKKIRLFVRTLISDWRAVVDEWLAVNPPAEVQEEGLSPSPQVEEGASMAAPTPSEEKKASLAKGAAVAEEEAEMRRQDTWKVVASEGRFQLRRVRDETKPSEPQREQAKPVLAQSDPKPSEPQRTSTKQAKPVLADPKPSEPQRTSTEQAEPVLAQPDPNPGLDEGCQMGLDNPTGGTEKPSGVDGSNNLGEPNGSKCAEQIE